ncbi:exodeoxyribonuclease 7 large subunit [Campylobacterota bacterium]|nr:exodeoxyribonuclease 7 large subunit [Campylobacterota bacterium]
MNSLSVSELTIQLKNVVEAQFSIVRVSGEVGRVTYHSSGHCYFSLKDKDAAIDAVMFRANLSRVKFKIEAGMKVIASGAISVYPPQGRYQIICESIEPDGVGALMLAYEQLKEKLKKLGWFEETRKKSLPRYPQKIALVTSASGAALQDMRRVADKRWKLTKLICVNTVVQGESAPKSIIKSIEFADRLNVDAIVLARGGGSMEDLWSFNNEFVAKAVYMAKTPIVSAIGHEIDFVITDFVADKRAPTPSAAIEMLLPDINEENLRLKEMFDVIDDKFYSFLAQKSGYIEHLKTLLSQLSPIAKIKNYAKEVEQNRAQLNQLFMLFLRAKSTEISHLQTQISVLENAKKLPPKTAQILLNNMAIEVGDLKPKTRFTITNAKHIATAETISVEII